MSSQESPFWSLKPSEALNQVNSGLEGLTAEDSRTRLKIFGENTFQSKKKHSQFRIFMKQFNNPIIIILLFATSISLLTGEWVDAQIILFIVLASALLSFYQEYSAGRAIEKLQSKVQFTCSAKRDGQFIDIPSREVVPGDLIQLSSGNLIPADGLLIENETLYVNQSTFTGESIAVEKTINPVSEESTVEERTNCLFMGTTVVSGNGIMLVMETGSNTQFGHIADHLALRSPETDFEQGVRHFGYLLSQIMLVLTLTVFAINVLLNKPAIDSLLFSVALAVGITPQLLPAIISITLSTGARKMAKKGVIVRRLNSIENFGSMDVLCTDKTGTLTEGSIKLDGAMDVSGNESEEVFRLAYLNATLQKGMRNSLDDAVQDFHEIESADIIRLDEIAFDFSRRRLSVLYKEDGNTKLVTKGAFSNVLEVCTFVELDGETISIDENAKILLMKQFESWSNQGIRVLGVATKNDNLTDQVTLADESQMIFVGFLLFSDHLKEDVASAIQEMADKGVELKIITGDNHLIAAHAANSVVKNMKGMLTGKELLTMSDEVLWHKVDKTTVFAEVDPNQKERIILALKKNRHVVGYMGDGINDVPALHAADVSISVDNAVDVAKESADIVLMQKSLHVLLDGIVEGRTTFNNTLKYILVTTSANFGNMFSVAGISMILPYFPLLPKQILLLNFLTDFPALTLSTDTVDEEVSKLPRKWDIKFIRRFMIVFGLLSSVFDYLVTFILFGYYRESQLLFQSGWFLFSILTELATLMVMRTNKLFFKSRPSMIMLNATLTVGIFTFVLLYTPLAPLFGLSPVPWGVTLILTGLISLYVLMMELVKRIFYKQRPIKE